MANRLILSRIGTLIPKFQEGLVIKRGAAGGAPVSEAIKKKQHLFQVDDGVPVHLKGGFVDVLLYRLTMGLCVIALGMIAKLALHDLHHKKK